MRKRIVFLSFVLSLCLGVAGAEEVKPAVPPVHFSREIRPIVSDKCFTCHGPDEHARKAGLRLDQKEGMFKAGTSGKTPAVPKDVNASEMVRRIFSTDPDEMMPPPDQTRQLTDKDRALLKRWVEEGAVWEDHWSFVAPQDRTVPAVAHPEFTRNPIDNFVVSRLEKEGLQPSPEADKASLIRRVTFDLTGLPPTREEIAAFLQDTSPNAYEKVVERLLQSPRYGEHMARYWLDLARYADTNGYHIDNERFMWRWRDWVIKSFNENMHFDDFTVQQLAGDLLPSATTDQQLASGFNRNHMITFEGGIIPEEYRVQYVLDRVNTLGTVWLGLTVGCAQCHDHKYDPVSMKEYYQFFAFFNSVPEQGSDGRDGNAAPFMRAPMPEQAGKLAAFEEQVAALKAQLTAPMPEADAAQAAWETEQRGGLKDRWTVLDPKSLTAQGDTTLRKLPDGSVLAEGANPDKQIYEFVVDTTALSITAIRVEALTDDSLPKKGHGRSDVSNVVLTEFEAEVRPLDQPDLVKKVVFAAANADFSQDKFDVALAIDGKPDTGWATDGHERIENRAALFVPTEPLGFATGTEIKIWMKHESGFAQHSFGRFRLSITSDPTMAGSALGTWHVSGPFVAKDARSAYDTVFEPEKSLDLAATYEDGRAKWVRAIQGSLPDGVVNDLSSAGPAATYLYRTVTSPTARPMTLGLGSNDAIKVWVNGQVVHDNYVGRGVAPDQDLVQVMLKEGSNDLLLKVVNFGNAYAFYFKNRNEQVGTIPLDIESILASDQRRDADAVRLREYYRSRFVPAWQEINVKMADVQRQKTAFEADIPTVMVMGELPELRDTFVLARGQYDQPTDNKVQPALPSALPPLPSGAPANRLGLAEWVVSENNPLTARVTVNRLWHNIFGVGLVKTVEDFGVQGERPSHPELLDWLSREFIRSDWDVKEFLRLIVSSATYRQSSKWTPELLERDPENRLLARAPRFRLDAEAVRDNALAVSGLLAERIGGPSVKPYQPGDLWKEVSYGGTEFSAQEFKQDAGEALYRRSMYTFWKRQAPPAQMLIFDAPTREVCTARRPRTNTPLQALQQLNDTQMVEASRHLAQRMLKEGGTDMMARIDYGFELATSRPPTDQEKTILCEVLAAQLSEYQAKPEQAAALLKVGESPRDESLDAVEHAAWTTIASMILNLDETITKG